MKVSDVTRTPERQPFSYPFRESIFSALPKRNEFVMATIGTG
jgi:hypothetical protein